MPSFSEHQMFWFRSNRNCSTFNPIVGNGKLNKYQNLMVVSTNQLFPINGEKLTRTVAFADPSFHFMLG
jgi:hypothetical protein